MEGIVKKKKWKLQIAKYRYPAIILLVGILLMILPGRKIQETPDVTEDKTPACLEERLGDILSTIDGVGDVNVLLSVSAGEKILYQSDVESNHSSEDESVRSKTILITDSQRTQNGLVQQINPPVYLGAVISCQGADDPEVRLAIVDAVSTVTGLGTDRISVVKMK